VPCSRPGHGGTVHRNGVLGGISHEYERTAEGWSVDLATVGGANLRRARPSKLLTRSVVLCRCRPNKRAIASSDGPDGRILRVFGPYTVGISSELTWYLCEGE